MPELTTEEKAESIAANFGVMIGVPADKDTEIDLATRTTTMLSLFIEAILDDAGLQTPQVLDSLSRMTVEAQAPWIRQCGQELLCKLARGNPDFAMEKAIATLETAISDPQLKVATAAADNLASLARGDVPIVEKLGELLARRMAEGDLARRIAVGRALTRYYPYLVQGEKDWEQKLSPVFHAAAEKHGVPAGEVKAFDAEIGQVAASWTQQSIDAYRSCRSRFQHFREGTRVVFLGNGEFRIAPK